MDMDGVGMDLFEGGPDPDAVLLQGEPERKRQQQDEQEYEAELAAAGSAMASAPKKPTKKQIAEDAVAAAVEQMNDSGGGGELENGVPGYATPRIHRPRIDPLMQKGGIAPNEWGEMDDLAEGVRSILVVCHSGLPRDKKRADKLVRAVKDRFGDRIHTHEWWDEDPALTEDDREDINTFEVWLEGPTVVHYHERADGGVDLDDKQTEKILDDIENRISDEAILGQHVYNALHFRLPGFRIVEQKKKQFLEA